MVKELIFDTPRYLQANHVGCNGRDRLSIRSEFFFIKPEQITKNYKWTDYSGKESCRDKYVGFCPICGKNIVADFDEYKDERERLFNIVQYVSNNIGSVAYITYTTVEKQHGLYYHVPHFVILDSTLSKGADYPDNPLAKYHFLKKDAECTRKVVAFLHDSIKDTAKVFVYA